VWALKSLSLLSYLILNLLYLPVKLAFVISLSEMVIFVNNLRGVLPLHVVQLLSLVELFFQLPRLLLFWALQLGFQLVDVVHYNFSVVLWSLIVSFWDPTHLSIQFRRVLLF
jgi:hypothetical protein